MTDGEGTAAHDPGAAPASGDAGAGADAFEALGPAVRSALSERGFEDPTEPQRLAVPAIANGEDTLVVAPTGSGKTETAMLPVFDAVHREGPPEGFAALYVTPLRALNRDMRDRLEWWGDYLGIDVDVRHGDTSDYRRSQQAADPPDVLVTTPETLQAMLTGERLREGLADVRHVVIDEIHELAAAKRGAQLTVALERLRDLAGPVQRVGLSATVGDPGEVGAFLTGGRGCTVRSVEVGSRLDLQVVRPEVRPADERLAAEIAADAETASHVRAIREAVADNESTLIFVNTRQTAEALGSRFKALDLPVGVHHGSLSKSARVETEAAFKSGDLDALLCTSSMELGIDVGRVDHVVQYQSPRQVTRLLQRVGRAGHRSDRTSSGTVLTTRPDDTLEAMAIARRALDGEVEPASVHEGSLDVVANQTAAMAYAREDGLSAMAAYHTVTSAWPFRDLPREEYKAVVRELAGNRIVWLDEDRDRIEGTGSTWQYVYDNLSMIPDEETYTVRDVASGTPVGTLDERFVRNFAERGAAFVQGGEMWRVVEVDDGDAEVEVSPVENPAGEVPSWVGQEIPVPRPVAGEVGELRRVAAPQLAEAPPAAVAADVATRYPVDEGAVERALDRLHSQVADGETVPTDRRLLVEGDGDAVVVNAAFGHRINETLGRVVSSLVGQQVGSSVGLEVDPYRIELDVPPGVSATDVADVLRETDPAHVRSIIELSLKRSDTLLFRLSQVAEHFGAVKSWQGDRGTGGLSGDRLRSALEDTPVYEEAVREVFHEDLDVEGARAVLEAIRAGEDGTDRDGPGRNRDGPDRDGPDRGGTGTDPAGDARPEPIELRVTGGRTPVGTGGRSSGRELLAPENVDADVVETVRERLREDRVRLFCLHCADWDRVTKVRRVRDSPECPECGATRVAALHPAAEDVLAAVRADGKDADQRTKTRRAHQAANLVQSHGKRAVIALAARGVGPTNAARIINNWREEEDDFYRDILAKEREYARTKSFWD